MSADRHDLVIVGGGPGGLGAAAHAQALGLSYVLLERADHLADTIYCYQARKPVMAEPSLVPLRSELEFEAGLREEVLGRWDAHAEGERLAVRLGQEVEKIERQDDGFLVTTAKGEPYAAAKVVLALGTQGNPRRLNVEGEDLPHVSTRLIDPADYVDKDILVVGAGDSALEVAIALAENNRVGLVVRKAEIVKAKQVLINEAEKLEADGQLTIHYLATPDRILPGKVEMTVKGEAVEVAADHVFVKIGGTPPRRLLEGWGVEFSGPSREALPRLSPKYESTVPGLYIIGAVAGRDLIKLAINQGYEVVEYLLGRELDPADEEVLARRMPLWQGKVAERIAQLRQEIEVFGAADELQLREMFLSAEVKSFADGEVILRQNDYTNTFLAIARGEVAISVEPESGGAPVHVATLSAGDFFGEMGLISGRRRNATATAVGVTHLVEVPRKAMVKLLATAPQVKEIVDAAFLVRAFKKYLFPDRPVEQLRELAARAELLTLDKDAVVFEEGSPGDAFYLIRSGMVKISKRSGSREIVLSYLEAGNSFGETALLDGVKRTATVTTIFPSEVIRLSKADCDAFLERYPAAGDELVAQLEPRRLDNLLADATPRAGEVLHDLISEEVVMGNDALIIDNHKCVRCSNCVYACEGVHDDGQARLSLTGIELYNILAPNSCWQCTDPKCMLDCPPDAIVRNARGEVAIKSNCIGCGNCEKYCPYDNIFMVYPKPARGLWGFVKRILGAADPEQAAGKVAVKCDLCADIAGGPACVRSCPTGAAVRLDPRTYQQTIEELVVTRGEG